MIALSGLVLVWRKYAVNFIVSGARPAIQQMREGEGGRVGGRRKRTSNIEHRTSNIEHRTSNIEH
jgi:hypothetical protein